MKVVKRDTELMQVVGAADSSSGLPRLLHGRQEQAAQRPDDGADHKQLDQRKPRDATASGVTGASAGMRQHPGPHDHHADGEAFETALSQLEV
jgi:hypothetical protein